MFATRGSACASVAISARSYEFFEYPSRMSRLRLGMLVLVALALAGVWTLNARASTGQQAEAPAHPAPASDTGRQVSMGGERDAASALLASDCRRPESEPSHLPDDLRCCKFPDKTDQFGSAPWTRMNQAAGTEQVTVHFSSVSRSADTTLSIRI